MATHEFSWKVDKFDSTTGIVTVTYTSTDTTLTPIATTLKLTDVANIANTIVESAPVHDWELAKNPVSPEQISSLTGSGTKSI